MNQLTTSGTYIVTAEQQDFIVVIVGSAPMLQVSRVFNLSKFVDDGSVEDSENEKVKKSICENPSNYSFRSIDMISEFQMLEVKDNEGKAKYSQKEYRKWLTYAKELEKPDLISKLMLERKDLTYPLCEILVEQLWKDKRNLLRP